MGFADVIISDPSLSLTGPDAIGDDLAFDLEFLDDKTLYEEIVKCGIFLTREEHRDCCDLVEEEGVRPDAMVGSGVGGPWSDLEEVRDWKIRVDATCARLSIHADPHSWSAEDVLRWCQDALRELSLPSDPAIVAGLAMDGTTFCMLNEEGFRSRAPQVGEALHAELANWKSVCHLSSESAPVYLDMNAMSRDEVMTSSDGESPRSVLLGSEYDVIGCSTTPQEPLLGTRNPFFSETSLKSEHQDRIFVSKSGVANHQQTPPPNYSTTTAAPRSRSTLKDFKNWPINRERHSTQLWQFLKELLNRPTAYGDCIRWTDHENGVFRIEDSTRVAKLWGERKHRPAMNYDKLSRSIRQYYKKGIIRKTQQSKRLVYQFYPQYI